MNGTMEESVNHVLKYVQTLVYHVLMETGVSTMQTLSEVLFQQQERTPQIPVFVSSTTRLRAAAAASTLSSMWGVGVVTRILVLIILSAPRSRTTTSTNDYADVMCRRSALPLTLLPTLPLVTSSSKIIRLPRSLDSELYRAHLVTEALLSLSVHPVQPHRPAPSLHPAAQFLALVLTPMLTAQWTIHLTAPVTPMTSTLYLQVSHVLPTLVPLPSVVPLFLALVLTSMPTAHRTIHLTAPVTPMTSTLHLQVSHVLPTLVPLPSVVPLFPALVLT